MGRGERGHGCGQRCPTNSVPGCPAPVVWAAVDLLRGTGRRRPRPCDASTRREIRTSTASLSTPAGSRDAPVSAGGAPIPKLTTTPSPSRRLVTAGRTTDDIPPPPTSTAGSSHSARLLVDQDLSPRRAGPTELGHRRSHVRDLQQRVSPPRAVRSQVCGTRAHGRWPSRSAQG